MRSCLIAQDQATARRRRHPGDGIARVYNTARPSTLRTPFTSNPFVPLPPPQDDRINGLDQHHKTYHHPPTMKFSLFSLAFVATLSAASPAVLEKRAPLCPALDTPLCCQLDIDGVVDATCEARETPSSHLVFVNATLTDASIRRPENQSGLQSRLRG